MRPTNLRIDLQGNREIAKKCIDLLESIDYEINTLLLDSSDLQNYYIHVRANLAYDFFGTTSNKELNEIDIVELEKLVTTYASSWHNRERKRFKKKMYKKLPNEVLDAMKQIGIDIPEEHYLHRSGVNEDQIAYTPNDDYGNRDRQVSLKIGRYISKHWPSINAKDIGVISNLYYKNIGFKKETLSFARTREEIAYIYMNGPSSCMSYPLDDYRTSGIHPTEVYACDPIAIAYIKKGDRIIARSVVNTDTKKYIRVYGNEELLMEILEDNGFTQCNSALSGCKLLRLTNEYGGIIGPFIDGDLRWGTEDGDFINIGSSGDLLFETTSGSPDSHYTEECEMCGEDWEAESLSHVEIYNSDKEEIENYHACPSCLRGYIHAYVVIDWEVSTPLCDKDEVDTIIRISDITRRARDISLFSEYHFNINCREDLNIVEDTQGRFVMKEDSVVIDDMVYRKWDVFSYTKLNGVVGYTDTREYLVEDVFQPGITINIKDPEVKIYRQKDGKRRKFYSLLTYIPQQALEVVGDMLFLEENIQTVEGE